MLRAAALLVCAAAAAAVPAAGGRLPPALAALLERARTEPAALAKDLRESELARIGQPLGPSASPTGAGKLPIVVAHGRAANPRGPGSPTGPLHTPSRTPWTLCR